MLDLAAFGENSLALALLRGDHDLITEDELNDQWAEGEVEEIQTTSRTAARWEMAVSYRGVNNDESTAYPNGRLVATGEVSPGEHDAYRMAIVVLFDELVVGHHVILEGDQGGAGESDESHEAWMHGTITVVPEPDGATELAEAVGRQRRDVMRDIAADMEKTVKRLNDATGDEMLDNGIVAAFGDLARQVARAV